MKTIEENVALFEEARVLRENLKQNLHENANNIGFCSVSFTSKSATNSNKRLVEQTKRKRRIKK